MSRCFPFPPPGYEKKARPDDAQLLTEDQYKEKKHKKDKDKEKRDGKEKREKDRSDSKHREKKDKKEKHKDKKEKRRDKKKDKEDKERGIASTSAQKQVVCQSKIYNGEKVNGKEVQGKDNCSSSDKKQPALLSYDHNRQGPNQNSVPAGENDGFKFVLELGKRIRDEQEGRGSLLVEKPTDTDGRREEETNRYTIKDTGNLAEVKVQKRDREHENKKTSEKRVGEVARSGQSAVAQNPSGTVQDRKPKPTEKCIGKKMEGKERKKSKDKDDDKRHDKAKDKEREKKSHGLDMDMDKEKKIKEKTKEKTDQNQAEQDRHTNNLSSHVSEVCYNNASPQGGLQKRKDTERNGFLHDIEVRPNKIPRPTTHPLTENGRKLDVCQNSGIFTSDRQGTANNIKLDYKERKLNGIIGDQVASSPTARPSYSATHADPMVEAFRKPPHPDAKYLNQVLLVPKMEVWSDHDDQEWLHSTQDPPSRKSEGGYAEANEGLRVWSEAIQIDSADICALPYVIPY